MGHSDRTVLGVVIGIWGLIGSGAPAQADIVVPEPMSWVIEAADYTGHLEEQVVRLDVRYTIRVLQDGWVQVPLSLGDSMITKIELEKKIGQTHIAPRGGTYVLVTNKKGTYKVLVKCSKLLTQDSQFEGIQLGIPQATFSTLTLTLPYEDVELRREDQLYVDRQAAGAKKTVLVARVGAAELIDLRWRTRPADPIKIEPLLYGETNTIVTLEEQLARGLSIVDYRISQGSVRQFVVRIPAGLNILYVRGPGIDDWRVVEQEGTRLLTVALGYEFKEGTYRLVIESEQTISESAAEYVVPELVLDGVKQERGCVAIARSGNLEVTPNVSEGIMRVDVKELPSVIQSGTGLPATLAYRYHQHPYRLALALTRHEDHAVLAAIAERAELATVLSRQGELLTRATYLIRSNKKQFLGVVLPRDATLWSCIVDGRSVKPVKGDQGQLLVPMDVVQDSTRAVPVELVYFQRQAMLTRLGELHLTGPVLDVPTTVANWAVYTPQDVRFLKVSGNLDRGIAASDYVEDPFIQLAAASGPINRLSELSEQGRGLAALEKKNGEVDSDAAKVKPRDGRWREDRKGSLAQAGAWLRGDDQANTSTQPATEPPTTRSDDEFQRVMEEMAARTKETGILPLKIRLPKSGTAYHFSRLMTAQDALALDANYVRVHIPWILFAGVGLILLPVGGAVVARVRKS